jgi:integrase/recombinase XerD
MSAGAESGPVPRYHLCSRHVPGGYSPYRVLDENSNEVSSANEFLDALAARGLSERSLRAYGYSLLTLWRWLGTEGRDLCRLNQADMLAYIRFQRRPGAAASAATINHRLTTVSCLYRFHTGRDIPSGQSTFPNRPFPWHGNRRSELGFVQTSRQSCRGNLLRVKAPRPVVVPLTSEEVQQFLESLRSWRDLSIVALMLLCGLRSREVINIAPEDVRLSEPEILVHGKGNKDRTVPLSPQVSSCLRAYLDIERPETATTTLFVCLKGPGRGHSMTPAGLRSLFRYHRRCSKTAKANPHRFRHTFGADMARAGISLPALMRLMGHASIRTTMLYIELTPGDVWEEFHRVVAKLRREDFRLRSNNG